MNCNFSILKSESSWEVLVKNGDFASCIITNKFFLSFRVIELDKEVKIGVPLLVIINRDLYQMFSLLLAHGHNLVHSLVVFTGLGRVVNSSISERKIILGVLYDCDVNRSIGLSHRVVQAFELNQFVLNFYFVCLSRVVNLTL